MRLTIFSKTILQLYVNPELLSVQLGLHKHQSHEEGRHSARNHRFTGIDFCCIDTLAIIG